MAMPMRIKADERDEPWELTAQSANRMPMRCAQWRSAVAASEGVADILLIRDEDLPALALGLSPFHTQIGTGPQYCAKLDDDRGELVQVLDAPELAVAGSAQGLEAVEWDQCAIGTAGRKGYVDEPETDAAEHRPRAQEGRAVAEDLLDYRAGDHAGRDGHEQSEPQAPRRKPPGGPGREQGRNRIGHSGSLEQGSLDLNSLID